MVVLSSHFSLFYKYFFYYFEIPSKISLIRFTFTWLDFEVPLETVFQQLK